ncbi:tetratricopeptide repeat-containing sensor histidine kinase [Mucilaginibacter sp. OK283]|jgi:signal transduction histidine kinase|uniref:tetratricopeptide repeat-containing sensor histidine kinase n=1 Tax=Mucilaginibacter sp. OK283 TaxID=1881049 RepID=UPI0008D7EC01|nr:tetratricopeptide repeat-containing sensor histidine kinase [Mucilaginibacter sp. OK283]SEO63354.1 His Kinase A (phospho-acceptor) domain-containing protein [Mucilaginibacter sp. OK283]
MKKHLSLLLLLIFAGKAGSCQLKDIDKIQKQLPLITDSIKYVDALNRLGMLMYEKNIDNSFYYAKLARAISTRLKYKQGEADALNVIGIVYDLRGNLQLSLRYYNDAYNHYLVLRDSANIVQTLMNIALVFNERKEDKKAIEALKQALARGAGLKKDSIISLLYCNYLLLYPDSVSENLARIYLDRARRIATKYKDERVLLVTDQVQANIYLKNGKREQGIMQLQKAAAEGIALDVNYVTLDILKSLGDLFILTDSTKAIYYYKQGLAISELKGYHFYGKVFGKSLYNIYKQNNLREAQGYSSKLLELYEAEEVFNNTSGLDYIDYAIKDQQIEALTTRAENRYTLMLVFGFLLLLTGLSVGIFYRLYRLKRRHNETLEELNRTVQLRNQKLEVDHEFNNRLVSILAHDFRQPLGSLKTLATVLKDADAFTHEELMMLVETMERSSDIALEIFENILQWIKQQLSGFSYSPVALPLRELIDEALQPFAIIARENKITLINNVDSNIHIDADKELVQFIHRNFIHNAIKFSPENSCITITGFGAPDEVTVCVQDEGKGISPEKLPGIFNFKIDLKYSSEKEKGAGVALMICSDFIDKMNGRIWVENNKGKGASFCYALPVIQKSSKRTISNTPVAANALPDL